MYEGNLNFLNLLNLYQIYRAHFESVKGSSKQPGQLELQYNLVLFSFDVPCFDICQINNHQIFTNRWGKVEAKYFERVIIAQ